MATNMTHPNRNQEHNVLRKLMKARIACGNSVRELETLDCLTDDWDATEEILDSAALDIHLQCEYSGKESSAIHETLTGLLSGLNAPGWLWTEVELRQENAVEAANEVVKIVDSLISAGGKPSLGLKEMKHRAQHIVTKLEDLKETFADLESEVQACVAEAQKQAAAKAPT